MSLLQRANALIIARILLASFLLTTALNRFTDTDKVYFATQLAEVGLPNLGWLSPLLGGIQLMLCLSLMFPHYKVSQRLIMAYGTMALIPMLMLFIHPVWIESLGGFPAIGAGQGLIKYLAISGVALYIASEYTNNTRLNKFARVFMLVGVLLVMVWIGGMKFTQIEADGIFPLMNTSPMFSWIYAVLSPLHASYFIGIIELAGVLAIFLYWWKSSLYVIGLTICALTFMATQTFVLSLPAYSVDGVVPLLTGSGQFIVKDLGLLAACLLLLSLHFHEKARR